MSVQNIIWGETFTQKLCNLDLKSEVAAIILTFVLVLGYI